MDAIVVNPGGRERIYQDLGKELTAIEPPMWARLITGFLLDRKWQIDILDTEALNMAAVNAAAHIMEQAPTLVIIVAFGHQPSASTQTMMAARELAQALKNSDCQSKVLIVGGHVAALPKRTLLEEPVDFICQGEGPETCHQLLTALIDNKPLHTVAGLGWQDDLGKVHLNDNPPLILDLDKELHGNVWHLLPMENYRAHNWHCFGDMQSRMPYASIYTTLGCPYKCVFCCINAPFHEQNYRCRSPEAVVAEIDHLFHQFNVKTFKIVDEMFVLKKNHYLKICQLLADKPYASELNIWAYARVDTVRKEQLELMRGAGIKWLALGIESADDSVRDGAKKSLKQQAILDIVRDIQAADINVIGNFIFGLPKDSQASMQATLDLALELNCEFANFYSAMAYPGSPLYQHALTAEQQLPEDWDGYSQHSYHCLPLSTEHLTSAQVLAFRDEAFHLYFENEHYLSYLEKRFDKETRMHVENMSKARLKRHIVELANGESS